MNTRRSRAGVATDGRLLYVIGGYDGSSDLNTAESYNPLANTWSYVTPMGAKRSCFGAAGLNGLIYCCGGQWGDTEDRTNTFAPSLIFGSIQ